MTNNNNNNNDEYKLYPVNRQRKPLKGFCLTVADVKGCAETVFSWFMNKERFNIYGYMLSKNDEEYKFIKL